MGNIFPSSQSKCRVLSWSCGWCCRRMLPLVLVLLRVPELVPMRGSAHVEITIMHACRLPGAAGQRGNVRKAHETALRGLELRQGEPLRGCSQAQANRQTDTQKGITH